MRGSGKTCGWQCRVVVPRWIEHTSVGSCHGRCDGRGVMPGGLVARRRHMVGNLGMADQVYAGLTQRNGREAARGAATQGRYRKPKGSGELCDGRGALITESGSPRQSHPCSRWRKARCGAPPPDPSCRSPAGPTVTRMAHPPPAANKATTRSSLFHTSRCLLSPALPLPICDLICGRPPAISWTRGAWCHDPRDFPGRCL